MLIAWPFGRSWSVILILILVLFLVLFLVLVLVLVRFSYHRV